MYQSWRSRVAVAINLVVACTSAQAVQDLGALLANQSELSTFYGLIQVCDFCSSFLGSKLEHIKLQECGEAADRLVLD